MMVHFIQNDKFQIHISSKIVAEFIAKHFVPDTAEHGYLNLFLKLLNRAENDYYVLNISKKM